MILFRIWAVVVLLIIPDSNGGISPVHDFKEKLLSGSGNKFNENFSVQLTSPHNVLKHLDNTILKGTKNVTQNSEMDNILYQISKDMVSAILSKLETQDKITRITTEALEAPGKNKGITAIETRRILDFISRTLSGHILSITRASTEPELHRLVYGLAQIAAEVSIVSALKDTTYASALSKKQSVDLSLRRKRSIADAKDKVPVTPSPASSVTVYSAILNKTVNTILSDNSITPAKNKLSPFSVISRREKKALHVFNSKKNDSTILKGFLNQTALDIENKDRENTDPILMEKTLNGSHYEREAPTLDTQELSAPGLIDDWVDTKEVLYKPINPDVVADIEIDQPEFAEEPGNEMKTKQKLERLEVKAKKAILYAGDVAYLTAASVVALRRALTASIEVQMSLRYAKNGMSNHQELMMNLAKTAAQQAGKQAKSATSKSLACERVIKLALKYTAQSRGAHLNHVANRIVMDTLSLETLAKSMAFVASDIAINSLYHATDVKPPT